LKDRPGRQSLVGESFATSSSLGPSKFAIFVTDLCKEFVSADIRFFKINDPEVKEFPCKVCSYGASRRASFSLYEVLVGIPEGKRPLGRPRRRSEDNIRMDLREIGWGGVDLIDLAQDRDQWRALVNTVMNLRVP
jgi:hypothetical protein